MAEKPDSSSYSFEVNANILSNSWEIISFTLGTSHLLKWKMHICVYFQLNVVLNKLWCTWIFIEPLMFYHKAKQASRNNNCPLFVPMRWSHKKIKSTFVRKSNIIQLKQDGGIELRYTEPFNEIGSNFVFYFH